MGFFRQHIVRSYFFILSNNLCLLNGMFRPFTFNVILIWFGLNLPFYCFLFVSFVSFSSFYAFWINSVLFSFHLISFGSLTIYLSCAKLVIASGFITYMSLIISICLLTTWYYFTSSARTLQKYASVFPLPPLCCGCRTFYSFMF